MWVEIKRMAGVATYEWVGVYRPDKLHPWRGSPAYKGAKGWWRVDVLIH